MLNIFRRGGIMESFQSNLRYEWKKYVVALWMILMTVFFININIKINGMIARIDTIESTMGGIEGIVSGSDYTLGNIESDIDTLEKNVNIMSKKVKRIK
jgi:hypothetical protein